MSKMCHDCPHIRGHTVGDETVVFADYMEKPHPCHNNVARACVGAEIQLRKRRLGIAITEDHEDIRVLSYKKGQNGVTCTLDMMRR